MLVGSTISDLYKIKEVQQRAALNDEVDELIRKMIKSFDPKKIDGDILAQAMIMSRLASK